MTNADIDVVPCPKHSPYPMHRFVAESRRMGFGGGAPLATGFPVTLPPATGMPVSVNNRKKVAKSKQQQSFRVRQKFPETWLWSEEETDAITGMKTIAAKVPDTITTWFANGFALSSTDGIGVASPAALRAFQPFFVSLTLPYSVVRGESLKVPATVFNYLKECLAIRVSLDPSDDFDVAGGSNTKMCVCGGRADTYKFKIKPKKLGKIPITVRATTMSRDAELCGGKPMAEAMTAADAMSKKLLVEPEGVKKEFVYSNFICPKDHDGKFKERISVNLPDKIVPGSVYATMSVVGDLMGPSMDGLDKLLAMPYGCGEQNMLKFAPNIYVMDYLVATNQANGKVEDKAKEYMKSGYQRELTYKHKDGAYSAFGERDKEGSTWLTAFVLRSYAQAQKYIFIDDKEIEDSAKWLMKHQNPDGCFKELGMVHHKEMKGGVTGPVTLTAFVINALLEAGKTAEHPVLQQALQCVSNGLSKVNDSYTASILAYTLSLAGSPEKELMITYLKENAIKEDDLTHWSQASEGKKKKSGHDPWYYHYKEKPANVEMTAYALMVYSMAGSSITPVDKLRIVKWLVKQRNSLGGFSSTQDTCVGLQALARYAGEIYSGEYNLQIAASAPEFDTTFSVTDENQLVLQRTQLPTAPIDLDVSAAGSGCALFQVSAKYNIPEERDEPTFGLKVDIEDDKTFTCQHTMRVCGSFTGEGGSNMALIDVTMPSGFEPVIESLDELLKAPNKFPRPGGPLRIPEILRDRIPSNKYFSRAPLENHEFTDGVVSLYFAKFDQVSSCVKFQIEQVAEVEDRKPAAVTIYDYYDTDQSATTTYKVGDCPVINSVA